MHKITEHRPPGTHFFGLLPQEVRDTVTARGWPKFRGGQLLEWVYGKGVTDPSAMTNLPARDRQDVNEMFHFATASQTRRQNSEDGTIKLLLTWPNGSSAETVMIPDADRRTACVSSQVGCPVACKFCASGLEGLKGNLTAGQIVEQVFQLNAVLAEGDPSLARRVTNIVFMGMGEPLANYDNVMRAIRIIHDPACFNLGGRRITVSTVGVPPKIRQLAGEELPLNLALSLHAPNEPLRRDLIPWASHFAL